MDEYGLHEVNVLVFSLQMLSVGPLYFIARVRIASYIVSRFLLADYMSIPQIPLLSKTARVIDIFFLQLDGLFSVLLERHAHVV